MIKIVVTAWAPTPLKTSGDKPSTQLSKWRYDLSIKDEDRHGRQRSWCDELDAEALLIEHLDWGRDRRQTLLSFARQFSSEPIEILI